MRTWTLGPAAAAARRRRSHWTTGGGRLRAQGPGRHPGLAAAVDPVRGGSGGGARQRPSVRTHRLGDVLHLREVDVLTLFGVMGAGVFMEMER